MSGWTGKVALVTGGGAGIGRAFARHVADRGGSVVVVDINAAAAEATAAAIGDGRALAVAANVASEAEVAEAVDRSLARFGRIDMLHNNASILHRNDAIEDISVEEFRRVIEINTLGTFLCARAVAPVMKRGGGGCIVNMSSRGGLRGQGHTLAYSTSKAGLLALTRCIADNLRPFNIRAYALSVGLVETAMTRGGAYLAEARRAGRYVFQPEEMAAAVAWLAEKHDASGAAYEFFGGEDGPEMRLLGDFAFEKVEIDLTGR